MYYFSSNYLYVLGAAFQSEPFYAILYSLPSIICLMLILLFASLITIIGIELKKDTSGSVRQVLSAQGMMLYLSFLLLVLSALLYWWLPTMSSIDYKPEYAAKVKEIIGLK